MLEKPEYSIINSNSFLIQGKNDKTIQLKSFSYNQDKKTITLKGEEGTIIIGNVLENIFRLKISGHFIVDKWLREKTFPYYRKNFGVNELEELINLLSRIEEQDNLITKKINPIVDEIIKTDTLIMPESFKS